MTIAVAVSPSMSDSRKPSRVATGIEGLDEVLLGGVKRGNQVLVEGAAGTGKTTLGLGFIVAGATRFEEPGVIITFELDRDRVMNDARGFGWDLAALIDARQVKLIQTSPEVLLSELRSSDGVLAQELKEMRARRLFIDGLTPIKLYVERNGMPMRADLALLVEALASLGVTTVMTAERGEAPGDQVEHERFVFDTIISLSRHVHRRRVLRRIAVEKSRGQDFILGNHAMSITTGEGIRVYRRAQAAPKIVDPQPTSVTRVSTGIPALDTMMEGGLYEGSITMVTGISGTGKTVAGMQFLCASAREGRRGMLVSLDEHPAQLLRNARTLGLELQPLLDQGLLHIHYESPLELDLDVHFSSIAKLVEEHRIDCIVFDSVAVYEATSPEEIADFLYALATHLKSRLTTVYFNYESPELLGVSQISEELKGSHLVDNIVLLSYVEISTQLRRALTVPKVRGSRNSQVTREFAIGEGGIVVLDENAGAAASVQPVPQLPFSSYYGLLSRSPTRHSPVIEEAIAKGDELPESAAPTEEQT